MKFAAWLTISNIEIEDNFVKLTAWRGESRYDKETEEYEKDGSSTYFLTAFGKQLVDDIEEFVSEGDKIFCMGTTRPKAVEEGSGRNKTTKYYQNWYLNDMCLDFEEYKEKLDEIREFLIPEPKEKEDKRSSKKSSGSSKKSSSKKGR